MLSEEPPCGALELYSRENAVGEEALDAMGCLPTMDKLDMEELSKALYALYSGRHPPEC